MPQVNARIDKDLYGQLSLYSALTQVPVSRCIAEAVEKWLERTGYARLKREYENIVSRGEHSRLNPAQKALLDIIDEQRGELGERLYELLKSDDAARNNSESRELAGVVEMPGKGKE